MPAWKTWRITKLCSVDNYINRVSTVQLWEKMYFFLIHSRIHTQNKGKLTWFSMSMSGEFPKLLLHLHSPKSQRHITNWFQSPVSFLQLHLLLMASLQLFLIHLHIFVFEILACPTFCRLSPSLSLITFLSWLFIYLLLPCWAIFPSSENYRKCCKRFVFDFVLPTTRISSSLYHLSKTKISVTLFEITLGWKAGGN